MVHGRFAADPSALVPPKSMSLTYEPASEPLHISPEVLLSDLEGTRPLGSALTHSLARRCAQRRSSCWGSASSTCAASHRYDILAPIYIYIYIYIYMELLGLLGLRVEHLRGVAPVCHTLVGGRCYLVIKPMSKTA